MIAKAAQEPPRARPACPVADLPIPAGALDRFRCPTCGALVVVEWTDGEAVLARHPPAAELRRAAA